MHVKESLYILFCCGSQNVLEYSSTGNEVNGRFILGYSWTIQCLKKLYLYKVTTRSLDIEGSMHKGAMYRAYIENYIKYIHIVPFCSKPSAWLLTSFCIEIEKKKKWSSVHRQSHEHRLKEPPTTPPTRATIYMTNGHPDRAWNRHVCFDIFCFVPFLYIRFAKLHSIPVFVYISFCFVPFRFVLVNFVTFHFVSFRFGKFRYVSFRFVPYWYISFRVSFRILQVPFIFKSFHEI
jgi:hypothetical protein